MASHRNSGSPGLMHVVQLTPGNRYPVGSWLGHWLLSLLSMLVLSILLLVLLLPAAPVLIPTIYLWFGWRLNRRILPLLQIDPYNGGITVAQVLQRKTGMMIGWPMAWPGFLAKLWLARVL